MKILNFGIIGLSKGNGHPYSWSAIFNGYDKKYMSGCPFPVILEYLSKKKFPRDAIKEAKVTHIWTQNEDISEHIAKASLIKIRVKDYRDMIGKIDALLLARDDSETHLKIAKPFIEAGIPIYIDKPLALTICEAEKIYSLEKYKGQIFSCSAMAYAPELKIDFTKLGKIEYIDACIAKDWNKYAIHIIEPILKILGNPRVKNVIASGCKNSKTSIVNFYGKTTACIKTLGAAKCPTKVSIYGKNDNCDIIFKDTFSAFKNSLMDFTQIVKKEKANLSKKITLNAVKIIEAGNA